MLPFCPALTSAVDVRNLLGDDSLLNEVAPFAFKEYNTEQMLVVDNNGSKVRFVLCWANRPNPC